MIDFSKYIGKYIILMTNDFSSPEELPGIRDKVAKVFKFEDIYVLVRPLTIVDLKDEDFVQWLHSMWKHDELNIVKFIKQGKCYENKIKSKS